MNFKEAIHAAVNCHQCDKEMKVGDTVYFEFHHGFYCSEECKKEAKEQRKVKDKNIKIEISEEELRMELIAAFNTSEIMTLEPQACFPMTRESYVDLVIKRIKESQK